MLHAVLCSSCGIFEIDSSLCHDLTHKSQWSDQWINSLGLIPMNQSVTYLSVNSATNDELLIRPN